MNRVEKVVGFVLVASIAVGVPPYVLSYLNMGANILIAVDPQIGVGVGYENGTCLKYAVMRPINASTFRGVTASAPVTVNVDNRGEYVCVPSNVTIMLICDAQLRELGYRCVQSQQSFPVGQEPKREMR